MARSSFRISRRRGNRLIAAWQPTLKYQPQGLPPEPNRFRPLESTLDYRNPSSMYKGELQSTLSNRMVFNVVAGYGGYLADYAPWRSNFAGPVVKGNPPRLDRETGLNLGANPKTNLEHRDKWQVDSGLSMFPEKISGGQHELKVGTTLYWRKNSVGWRLHPAGDYTLVFDRVNNVSGTPAEIRDSQFSDAAGFSRQLLRRLRQGHMARDGEVTLNLGLRYRAAESVPAGTVQRRPARSFRRCTLPRRTMALDVLTWNTVVPRVGLAWDVANKTVVKATFGRFVNGMDDAFANAYNPMANITTTFNGAISNGNRDYTPGEVNLNPNRSEPRDFISVTGASSARLNPELRPAMTNETTVGVEREIMQNLGVRVLYVIQECHRPFGPATSRVRAARTTFR